ncbi:trypsin alpha-4-like [Chironomus tepperi]|uniref:trypsin alpha-4-like n=1 Tax=Chironomus tepperi TaxID=113505 RepID=UPI00391F40CE
MFRLLVAVTLIACSLAAVVPDATETEEFKQWSGRIVGGNTATPGQFPYQASMRSAANSHFCGASIINHRWVVCAAHCTVNRLLANTFVVVGAHHRVTGGTTHATERIVNHPNYSSITLANDVSLVRSATDFVESSTVRFIQLEPNFISTAFPATASGWGQTSNPGSAAEHLQYLIVEAITNEECRSRLSLTNAARIGETTLCVSSPNGQGLCMGDSGGPLTVNGRLVGAVSWGVPCGTAAPDMFARISAVHAWLVSIIDV